MEPAVLIALSGPLRGLSFRLERPETTLGREPSCDIHIMESAVSRRHCLIRRQPDGWLLCDLGSLNGTIVNGVPIEEHRLHHGDQIRLGQTEFIFQEHSSSRPAPPPIEFRESACETRTILQPGPLDQQPILASLRALGLARQTRDAQHLETLLDISTNICSVRNLRSLRRAEPGALERQILERIAQAVPSAQSAILHMELHDEVPLSAFLWPPCRDHQPQFAANLTLVREALRTCSTLLAGADARPSSPSSRHDALTLVSPLFVNHRPSGVIYLEAASPATAFTEAHARLLAAIAGVASLAFENLRHWQWLEGENQRLLEQLRLSRPIVGESPRMRALYQFVAKVAASDSTILICGESGTGKELLAHAIHENSPRAAGPFVAINCAAITETLLESELFGHERGAFTGAVSLKKGKLEVADGGTLFLDEIGELPLPMQAKLLRVLQEREFERVGGTRPIRVSVRIIAATNRDLTALVRAGAFRQDLFYRLNVVSTEMPPLRQRKEDIPLLARYFAVKHGERAKRKVSGISPEARELLLRYDWPGNVRELENAIERAIVLGSADVILPEDLPETLLEQRAPATPAAGSYHDAIAATKRRLILDAFRQARGNYTETARLLGVHPNYLHRLIRNLDLKAELRRLENSSSTPSRP